MQLLGSALVAVLLATAVPVVAQPPSVAQRGAMATAVQAAQDLSAQDILRRAHEAAGGAVFVRPQGLFLEGYNIIHTPAGEVLWDRYAMWRVYADGKDDAHAASGKVRIEAWSGDRLALLVAFDGATSYSQDGPMDDPSAAALWNDNFGFGAIRNALDEGWQQRRVADQLIDNAPTFMIQLTDPAAGQTLFGVRQSDWAIVYVGFETPRGWHERHYSHFFSKPGSSWVQPGRVRLSYNGIRANEAIWTNFELRERFEDSVFTVFEGPSGPSW